MRKFLMICLTIVASLNVMAQQKSKTDYMSITIYEYRSLQIGRIHNMIVTRTDTAQLQIDIDLKSHGKMKDYLANHEDTLLTALKPYFNAGWKLVSASVEVSAFQGNTDGATYRYYFTREQ